MKLKAVIIDDETKIREVFIELMNEHCPQIEIIGQASNINDGYALIMTTQPQVVFLDIEMPGGTGFHLLNKFDKIFFETIFVSSYGHYAIRALRLSALDFLLKPVLIDDLLALPSRIIQSIELKESAFKYKLLTSNLSDNEAEKKIVIQTKTKLESIPTKDIIYLKADGNYTTLFIKGRDKVLISKTLKDYEETLCDENSPFIRIHKAFLVNINYIKAVERGEECFAILNDSTRLEVSRRKKSQLNDKISTHRFHSS
ncbi:MAG TPA: LytTR family DNA-binding domain-containing protein [Bacteroidia bacterium]|nr:LytTR family DNA-binding domain-containing protein [Bacteroidia bacterium]